MTSIDVVYKAMQLKNGEETIFMREDVARCIEKYNKKKQEKINNFLLYEGIYDRVYAPEEIYDTPEIADYPMVDNETQKRYKNVPANLTEDEYKELMDIYEEAQAGENGVANVLKAIGYFILTCGIVASICLGVKIKEAIVTAIVLGVMSIISCVMFIALAEIINLLDKISKK